MSVSLGSEPRIRGEEPELTFAEFSRAKMLKVADAQEPSSFETKATKVAMDVVQLLSKKNKKYGDSALNPIRVFSKASPVEQLLVRLDDKLSRLKTQSVLEDEDVLTDLLGYLILLKIAKDER